MGVIDVVLLAVVAGYLLVSAVVTFSTVGQPRRAFDLPLSIALGLTRAALAIGVLGVIVAVQS